MADPTRATPAPVLMLPIAAFYSVLQEFARSWHQLQAYLHHLQQENQHLRHEQQNLSESQVRQEQIFKRQNAIISVLETSTSHTSGAHFQQPASSDSSPNFALAPARLPENHLHEGLEELKELYEDTYGMGTRKRLKLGAEGELMVDVEQYPLD